MVAIFFFSIWVFFHQFSRITGLQRKGKEISLTPHYHFHQLHRHLDISRAITAESLPLHIATSRTWVWLDILKTSWRRLGRQKIVTLKTCWRHLQDKSWMRFQDVLKTNKSLLGELLKVLFETKIYMAIRPSYFVIIK